MTRRDAPAAVVRVPAKVNLELRVGAPREDGFHGLATVYHAVDIFDEVTVELADDWGVEVHGDHADKVPVDETNSAMRAARLLAQRHQIDQPVHLTIEKSIPVAGGMAGGSADAAAALLGCDAVWGLDLSRPDLETVAAKVGSDVPFLLTGGTALGSGRGEHVVPVLTQGTFDWVFALHHEGLSTATVYARVDQLREGLNVPEPSTSEALMTALRAGDVDGLAAALSNDMEEAACSLVSRLRTTMMAGLEHGALATIVSGSGPTVAFLARDRTAAIDLMVALSADGLGDEVVHARGPVVGAQIIREQGLRTS
ncbi:4-(cytidine 5'-diphospho)-2-C-methyl-D-erythritol kinase [Demetria terragena]|uniref:4-(cytidine 5'-diphospho)-2-C-methyl-D-erythritol kinase n=1 Tax=Demetria terragena TaxID=63959 RepID=UPI0003794F75|nr:4-(cytidine 5'-diphospho)-2-C-methyl-D-erythritol kinase [Demetria terragena]